MKRFLSIPIICILFLSCKPNTVLISEAIKRNEEIISQKKFSINCTTIYPTSTAALQAIANKGLIAPGNSVSQINVNPELNYFKVSNDSINVSLAYYGEQQIPIKYGRANTGIQFEGVPKEVIYGNKDKKGNTLIKYSFKNGLEQFKVHIKVYSSGNSDITINSSHRLPIRYRGKFSKTAPLIN